ncbi:hypothetical protein BDM02DRAFT_1973233 [Thelephora ganbajun]|uniref:Uncharacterized protein n=1 Tax=Thelephora ganbajun TaxID=370292 RepID=A0ACB6ZIJ3_THEGA|nr:hypothetical protein BDM02DRAFT_1973233 [Thelephora ganbajun]
MSDLTQIAGKMPILTGKANYRLWAMELEATSQLGGFWGAYIGKNNPIEETAAQKDAVAQREMKAMGFIKKTVSPIIALEIHAEVFPDPTSTDTDRKRKPESAKEIFDYLATQYEKKDAISSLLDYRQLLRATLTDDGTLEAQLGNLYDLRSRCSLHGLKLEDYQFAAIILISLPETYSHIANNLLASDKIEDLTVEGVRAKIVPVWEFR